MGYTHYFTMRKEASYIKEAKEMINTFLSDDELSNFITREFDDPTPPIVEEYKGGLRVIFNGHEDKGYETFWFDSTDTDFAFCKTGREEYDFNVCVVLLILKHFYGDVLDLRSDGFYGNIHKEREANPGFTIGSKVHFPDGTWAEAIAYVGDAFGLSFHMVCEEIRGEYSICDCSLKENKKLVS